MNLQISPHFCNFVCCQHHADYLYQRQELRDLRSLAGKLVSQLAQIPSSAVYLKDVLLDMPAANRQQLQVLFFQIHYGGQK